MKSTTYWHNCAVQYQAISIIIPNERSSDKFLWSSRANFTGVCKEPLKCGFLDIDVDFIDQYQFNPSIKVNLFDQYRSIRSMSIYSINVDLIDQCRFNRSMSI